MLSTTWRSTWTRPRSITSSGALRANEPRRLSQLLVIQVDLLGLVLKRLPVICAGKAPEDVIDRGLVHVLLQVVESMLRHIREAHVRVPPDQALLRLEFADEKLDGRGLPSAVGTDNGNSRSHARGERNVLHRVLLVRGVPEEDVTHLQDLLGPRLDALEGA